MDRPDTDKAAVDKAGVNDAEHAGAAPSGVGQPPAAPPGGWPSWFDPAHDLLLTPRRLRGLVHPLRVRLLWMLETDGPSTASRLGRRIGHSSGVTSYHLRILAELGFVEEDTERGTGRDRWWRTRYRDSGFTLRSPDDLPDLQSLEATEQYMRIVVETYYERMLAYVNSFTGRLHELPTLPWTFGEYAIELTHDEARALSAEVIEVIRRYRRTPGAPPRGDGAERALFQFQMLPDDPGAPAPGGRANSADTNSAATDSAATDSAATDSAATNSAATNSAATNSAATNSAATNSAATNSAATNSAATNSAATNSAATNSAATNSAATDSAATDSAGGEVPS